MKITTLIAAFIVISSCTLAPRDNSRTISRMLVGQWEWEEGPEDCRALVNMAFRGNGTYTRTSESCGLADDGFGMFDYGWYVASGHVCFVSIEEQWEDEKPRRKLYGQIFNEALKAGYSKEKCPWRIEKASYNKITVVEEYEGYEPTTFTMERKRWL